MQPKTTEVDYLKTKKKSLTIKTNKYKLILKTSVYYNSLTYKIQNPM